MRVGVAQWQARRPAVRQARRVRFPSDTLSWSKFVTQRRRSSQLRHPVNEEYCMFCNNGAPIIHSKIRPIKFRDLVTAELT
jgi:hypothetical protein